MKGKADSNGDNQINEKTVKKADNNSEEMRKYEIEANDNSLETSGKKKFHNEMMVSSQKSFELPLSLKNKQKKDNLEFLLRDSMRNVPEFE